MTSLSEQELIDCDTKFNSGCNGGLMDYAFAYIVSSGGIHKEEDYPYLMAEGTCEMKRVSRKAKLEVFLFPVSLGLGLRALQINGQVW